MKKRILENRVDYDFYLMGVVSSLKEYKFAFQINHEFDIELVKERDVKLEFIKNQNLLISNFLYKTENSRLRLLRNRSVEESTPQTGYLLPELREFDYLILVEGFDDTFSKDELKQRIASMPGVQFTRLLQIDQLKSRDNLVF